MASKEPLDWLIVLPSDSLGGGAEQLVYNVTDYLSDTGKKCTVIILQKKTTGRWEPLEKHCKVKYGPFNSIHLGYLWMIPSLIGLSFVYSIRHTFSSQTLINGFLGFMRRLGFFKNAKIVVRESNSIFHLLKGFKLKMYATAYKVGYSGVDLIICQTGFMKDQLLEAMPWMKKKLKILVLSNPINLDLIRSKSTESVAPKTEHPYLVAAGRLSPVKGFDILIPSFKELQREFPKLKLLILGVGSEEKNLKLQIEELGLKDSVVLGGFVNNVYPYFRDAELCVMSSRIEGFPNVLLQMMSQNTKVVSTLSAGGIDAIPGIYTCEIEDGMALTNTMRNCLQEDTSKNKVIFNDFLSQRTLKHFLAHIEREI